MADEDRTAPLAEGDVGWPGAPPQAVGFPSGTVIDRYVVVRPLGKGGMGAVMLAFDTQLGRSVALKVMLTEIQSDEARIRFVREAQAMARLSHPNVVGIYDVGVHEGNVFLALEYVDGILLSEWIKREHSVRDVLAVMKQAGEGLRAAHEANVIHRDFKPTNVIIARDGRVCVFDFGIARTEGVEEPTIARAAAASGRRPAAVAVRSAERPTPLTAAGSMIGTVGYASPEQTLGEATDARSDIFSFAVTLWLALYGDKPFDSSSVADYIGSVHDAVRPARPSGTLVPAWLHPLLERGLARDPRARFASMKELLSAMESDPTRRRLRLGVVAAVVIGASLVVAGTARHHAALHAVCRAEGDVARVAWAAKRGAVDKALRAETDSFAGERTDRTLSALDAYVASWHDVRVESCEATRVAKTQTEETYGRRDQCLLQLQMEVDVVADVLAGDDPKMHHQSLAMASELNAPTQCTDAATSKTMLPLPSDPPARAKSLEARRDLLRAQYPGAMGFADARKLAEHARDLAGEAKDAQAAALADFVMGFITEKQFQHQDALQAQSRAYSSAEAIGQDSLAAAASLKMAFILGNRLDRDADAHEWLAVARATIARMGGAPSLEIDALKVEADIETDPRRALDLNARAIAATASAYGDTSVKLCSLHQNRGTEFHMAGEQDRYAAETKLAIECQIRATASATDDDLIGKYINLGGAQLASGHGDEALASEQRATALATAHDPDASRSALSLAQESRALTSIGRAAEAIQAAERAASIAGRHADKWMSAAQLALGLSRAAAGDRLGAQEACSRAVALDDRDDPPSPEKLYEDDALRCLGEAELALGDLPHARMHLERGVALVRRADPGALALSRFALARALVASPENVAGNARDDGRDESRARALAAQARDELRGDVDRYPFLRASLDAVDAWLAAPKP